MKVSEEDFYTNYIPKVNHILRADADENDDDSDIGHFGGTAYETYGPELDYILAMARDPKLQKHVWTITEGDNDKMYVQAGYHLVDRFMYMVTENPWITGEEEVELD
jgi:hypothetical protein